MPSSGIEKNLEANEMVIDQLIEQIKRKKNPCIVGIDPEWGKIPECYKTGKGSATEAILQWATDVLDAVADIVPAIKPQMAFFEVFGAEGVRVHQKVVQYAHDKGLIVVDDSKRNDIGNTAQAYAYAHLAKDGPINADFMTVSPFLGTDSIQPFIDVAISEGQACVGKHGYSSIGAVVGATFPEEAQLLRKIMKNNFFLVPGFGAQGGGAKDVVPCFNDDGLGAIVSSSRGVLYKHLDIEEYDNTKEMYQEIVRKQAQEMQKAVYRELKENCQKMTY